MIRRGYPLLGALLFVAAGCLFVPYAGIQNDEALFAAGLYDQHGIAYQVTIRKLRIPLMLMSYLGTLKAWIYAPLLRIWTPSPLSVRLPMLLLGAATLGLFSLLLRRIQGDTAARIGYVLLASDTTYLLTTCFDWGPVALQHLLLVSGALGILVFYHNSQVVCLALGSFFFGLAVWDKALSAWVLVGMGLATVVVFPRELLRRLRPRHVLVGTLSFSLGALPLLLYNVQYRFETLHQNARFDSGDLSGKTHLLRSTLDGSGLFGYIARDDAQGAVRQPSPGMEQASVWLSRTAGEPRYGYLHYALGASVLLLPWLWFTPARRPAMWAFLAGLTAWLQMLFTRDAGGSVHHVVLLWPLPHWLVAVTLAELWRRVPRLVGALVLLLAGTNLLVSNQHLAQLIQNGPGKVWTDAIYPLSETLRNTPASEVFINDWGILDTLRLLDRGKLPLRVGSDPLSKPQLDEADRKVVLERLRPDAIFVSHTDGNEEFPGVNQHLREIAAAGGFERRTRAVIRDRHGREMFEVFGFERRPESAVSR